MNTDDILMTMKVLYIEDEDEAREELVDVLKRRVGRVMSADNGRTGLDLYYDFEPDIIIADLYMPEMNGLEMIRHIKQDKKDLAFIILSAANDVKIVIEAIDVGVDKYISKPVNMQDLLKVLSDQAISIYNRRRHGITELPRNKKHIEDEIKKEFAAFLKQVTGKGPKNVNAFIRDGYLELVASEVLTVFERNLLDNNRNVAIIKHNRELFFSVKSDEICKRISVIMDREVSLKEVFINIEKDRNKLIFAIDRER